MEEDHRDELLPAGDVVLNVGSVLREEEVLESNDDEVQDALSGLAWEWSDESSYFQQVMVDIFALLKPIRILHVHLKRHLHNPIHDMKVLHRQ